ncbi:unnamed protein product [Schistosoma curassoni]|uniref:Oxidoreductase n=1 Tax=Schistosoma curassoni TaxID=6186 RepID=A0A183JMA3_9TREM|nr:unnamed protein product [Schistosoma curassoni]
MVIATVGPIIEKIPFSKFKLLKLAVRCSSPLKRTKSIGISGIGIPK